MIPIVFARDPCQTTSDQASDLTRLPSLRLSLSLRTRSPPSACGLPHASVVVMNASVLSSYLKRGSALGFAELKPAYGDRVVLTAKSSRPTSRRGLSTLSICVSVSMTLGWRLSESPSLTNVIFKNAASSVFRKVACASRFFASQPQKTNARNPPFVGFRHSAI